MQSGMQAVALSTYHAAMYRQSYVPDPLPEDLDIEE